MKFRGGTTLVGIINLFFLLNLRIAVSTNQCLAQEETKEFEFQGEIFSTLCLCSANYATPQTNHNGFGFFFVFRHPRCLEKKRLFTALN